MKKLILFICVIILSISAPLTALAGEPANIVGDKAVIEKLLSDGLSQNDAEYYAALDKFVKELESKGQVIDFANAKDLDDQWVRANPVEFRNMILKGDKATIKKAVLNQAYKYGERDIKALQDADKKSGKTRNKYTVKYPDGSSISLLGITVKQENDNKKVSTNTNIAGPWDESTFINETYPNGAGTWVSTTEWRYTSGVNYSKVKDVLTWGYAGDGGDYHAWYISDTGASASYGVVSVASETLSNHTGTDSRNFSGFNGYTDVRFQVSGSFSASYNGLGISVSAGGTWHQYAVAEVYGPFVNHWSAQYT